MIRHAKFIRNRELNSLCLKISVVANKKHVIFCINQYKVHRNFLFGIELIMLLGGL